MSRYDRISTLFLVGVAVVICVESIRLGTGSLSNPGPGLFPFGCGLVLGFAGLIVFGRTFKSAQEAAGGLWDLGTQWGKMISIIVSLIAYAFLIDLTGFRLLTLIWMGFMCRGIGKMGWKTAIFTSVVTTFFCYLLFENYLTIRFPRGILGF